MNDPVPADRGLSHPGDRLDAAIASAFPDATVVEDDGGWTTVYKGRFGALHDRYVPLAGSHTTDEA